MVSYKYTENGLPFMLVFEAGAHILLMIPRECVKKNTKAFNLLSLEGYGCWGYIQVKGSA
jgi:hypothetical protein